MTPSASSTEIELNRLKFNNILLYFILIFITELNGAQISMMANDKIGNIFVYFKYSPKLFGNLRIKKNINDMETIPITNYPVLCYLIFIIGYFLIKYKLWYYPASNTKQFNPYYLRIIIHSIVDLFNGISMDAGKNTDNYIYMLTVGKLYSQLNSTFRNDEIINRLKQHQVRYSDKPNAAPVVTEKDLIKTYSIENPITLELKPRKIPNFKISPGIQIDNKENILYHDMETITDLTHCPYGSSHFWFNRGGDIQCLFCSEKGEDVHGKIDRSIEAYYYILNIIASHRCLEGTVHNFVGNNSVYICTICGRKKNEVMILSDYNQYKPDYLAAKFKKVIEETYSNKDLDKLAKNLDQLENERIEKILKNISTKQKIYEEREREIEDSIMDLTKSYKKESGEKMYGQITIMTNKFIGILETYLGKNINLNIGKYPVYLRDNVYIIDHSYDGSIFTEPVILTQKDNRVMFRENHLFFKTDVYYYTDNRTQIDVYYHAVTLQLLGYKEKHKDYVRINKSASYLKIVRSIQDRILTLGFETKYIDISTIFMENSKTIPNVNENYFQIMDSLIREHIFKIKSIIDKITSVLYKIKNYQPVTDSSSDSQYILSATKITNELVNKYNKILADVKFGDDNNAFDEWNDLRNLFVYQPIKWSETSERPSESMYINSDTINYYDISSNLMVYYLINELIMIIDSNPDKITKTNICQLYVEVILYIYNIYNMDSYKNSLELNRFMYILNGSIYMVDILKKGQGLVQSKELEEHLDDDRPDIIVTGEPTEEQLDEIDDLKEEAEALDVEGDYYEDDEDNASAQEDYND